MTYVQTIVFLFLSLVIGSIGIIRLFIIFSFGIPFTKDLVRHGVLTENNLVMKGYYEKIAFWTTVIATTTFLTFIFTSKLSFSAYCVGVCLTVLLSKSKCGASEENIKEYTNSYKKFFITQDEDMPPTLI